MLSENAGYNFKMFKTFLFVTQTALIINKQIFVFKNYSFVIEILLDLPSINVTKFIYRRLHK